MKRLFDKRGIVSEYLPWILIAVSVLVILILGIVIMKEKGVSIIDRVGELLKGR